jgi:hypothetical protein
MVRPRGRGRLVAAVVGVALVSGGAWLALRGGDGSGSGTGRGAASDPGSPAPSDAGDADAPSDPPSRPHDPGERSAGPAGAASAGRGDSAQSAAKAPPGTRGVGRWKPKEPPREVVKDADTVELEKALDALMQETQR